MFISTTRGRVTCSKLNQLILLLLTMSDLKFLGAVQGSFVKKTTTTGGGCSELTNGFMVKNIDDCSKGLVAVGWNIVPTRIGSSGSQNYFVGGCLYFGGSDSSSTPSTYLNPKFDSAKPCDNSEGVTGSACVCWIGSTCSKVNGTEMNPSDCMCGSNICDADEGLYCLETTNECSKIPACAVTNGSAVNSNECVCGSTTCTSSSGLFCDVTAAKGGGQCSLSSDSWFVKASTGTCADISGKMIQNLEDCGKGAVILGYSNTVASDLNPDYYDALAGGCFYYSTVGAYLNPRLHSPGACGAMDTTCICFVGNNCSNIDGKQFNPSACICGTKICTASTGLLCTSATNKCTEYITVTAGSDTCEILDDGTCFQTVNYPNNYAVNKTCIITVNADGGKLNVIDFDVEAGGSSCSFDSVTVHGTKYCGITGPSNVKVNSGDTISWKSDTWGVEKGFKICYKPRLNPCHVTNGTSANFNDCLCGTNDCTASIGLFCRSSVNKCGMLSPCTISNGSVANDDACTCGTNDCTMSSGLFCQSSLNKCAKVEPCVATNGSVVNDGVCTCGTKDCNTTTGLYCKIDFCSTFVIGSESLPNGDESYQVNNYYGTGLRRIVSDFEEGSGSLYDAVILKYGPIKFWDVSNVTNMVNIFRGKASFNGDISQWNTAKVTDMKNSTYIPYYLFCFVFCFNIFLICYF